MQFVVPPSGGLTPPKGGTTNFDLVCFLLEITLNGTQINANARRFLFIKSEESECQTYRDKMISNDSDTEK
ncbi:hypothetical protein QUF80_10585 [Desulfococcaceae bacterium HSG8]|nr:hypothetical protein [Desulfococcaceae bacterium HSG8]